MSQIKRISCQISALGVLLIPQIASAQTASDAGNEAAPKTEDKSSEAVSVFSERIIDDYSVKNSSGAAKLDLPIKETPQTVNTVTRQAMEDFHLSNARSALAVTPGVIVQNQETDRTSYMSRGSEISNFQTDGLGVPFGDYNYQGGDIDTFLFDRIEVVKGANGLNSSLGDPGATVNFIRKRPTRTFQTGVGLSYGSWDTSRIEGDVSAPLNSSGTVRGRILGAGQKGNSYLDHYSSQKTVFAGTLEFDLTDSTLLTIGHSQQDNKPEGNNWGALPLLDQNGNQISYSRNYNPVADWANWDRNNQNSFVELQQKLGDDWTLKATYQLIESDEKAKLVYYFGAPNAAGEGVSIYSAKYKVDTEQRMIDANLSGSFSLFDMKHEAVLGTSWSRNEDKQDESPDFNSPAPNWNGWTGQFAEPTFAGTDDLANSADDHQEIQSVYAATRLHLTNDFKVLLGVNNTTAKSSGNSYGVDLKYEESKTLPYAGITYDFADAYTAYTSYSTIYRPQSTLDSTGKRIDSVEGQAYEVGVKGEFFGGRLLSSISLFQTLQKNFPVRPSDSNAIRKLYEVADLKTQGYELNLNGKIDEQTNLIFGFTQVRMKDAKTNLETRTYLPTRYASLLATHELRALPALKIGAGATWQSRMFLDVEGSVFEGETEIPYAGRIRQGEYALYNLMANYDLSKDFSVQANFNNVGNKKYLNSFPDAQGFYGAPANYVISFNYANN